MLIGKNSTATKTADFKEWDESVRFRHSVAGCILAMVLMPAGIGLDAVLYPQYIWEFVTVRLLCDVGVCLVLFALLVDKKRRFIRPLGVLWALLPALAISYMIAATNGVHSTYHTGLILVMIAVTLLMPWTLKEVIITSLLTLLLYAGACIVGGFELELFVNNFFFLSLIAVICGASSFYTSRNRIQEFSLQQQVLDRNNELTQSYDKLARLEEAKSRFLANASHELRTPLTVVLAPLEETLERDDLHEDVRNSLTMARSNALRLLKLINDLLESMRLDNDSIQLECRPIELSGFIAAQVESAAYLAKMAGIQLHYTQPDMPMVISGDVSRLERIMMNLLSNAVKFTPTGGRVDVACTEKNKQAVITVTDTGIGIPKDQLDQIFERFYQVDSSDTREFLGSGIGLSLVRELVELHDGSIEVASQPEKGSCFTLSLPIQTEPSSQQHAQALPGASLQQRLGDMYREAESLSVITTKRKNTTTLSPQDTKRYHIYVIDDEPAVRAYLEKCLSEEYNVTAYDRATAALSACKESCPDAILVDMMMPEMNGIQFCQTLRNDFKEHRVRVVMLTARSDSETKLKALEGGADDFLLKPFSVMELRSRLRNLLQAYGLQEELRTRNTELDEALSQLRTTEAQLIQSEKVNALGVMAGGILHEVNNPLNYAMTALHFAKSLPTVQDDTELAEIVGDAEEGMERIKRITTDLKVFAHPSSGRPETDKVLLTEVLSKAERMCSHDLKGIAVHIDVNTDIHVSASKENLIHVFINIFSNACRALRHSECPQIEITTHEHGDNIDIRVTDNGSGIAPQNIDKIFDPFFSDSDIGDGIGLGLSLCRTIVQQCSGSISAESDGTSQTTLIVSLKRYIREGVPA